MAAGRSGQTPRLLPLLPSQRAPAVAWRVADPGQLLVAVPQRVSPPEAPVEGRPEAPGGPLVLRSWSVHPTERVGLLLLHLCASVALPPKAAWALAQGQRFVPIDPEDEGRRVVVAVPKQRDWACRVQQLLRGCRGVGPEWGGGARGRPRPRRGLRRGVPPAAGAPPPEKRRGAAAPAQEAPAEEGHR